MKPLLAICGHCYEPSVGSYQPDKDDHEVFLCERHTPSGVQLQALPLIDYRTRPQLLRMDPPARERVA